MAVNQIVENFQGHIAILALLIALGTGLANFFGASNDDIQDVRKELSTQVREDREKVSGSLSDVQVKQAEIKTDLQNLKTQVEDLKQLILRATLPPKASQ